MPAKSQQNLMAFLGKPQWFLIPVKRSSEAAAIIWSSLRRLAEAQRASLRPRM